LIVQFLYKAGMEKFVSRLAENALDAGTREISRKPSSVG
jgi:hypothetical protein